MRDRHFITWLVGLIAVPVLFTMFPALAATAAATVPIVLGAAALVAMIATGLTSPDDEEVGQHRHSNHWEPLRLHRPISHH